MKNKWTLPLILGILTALVLAVLLWPTEEKPVDVVVAARDLGAGQVLTAGDLATITMSPETAPADAVTNPEQLVGQTLAVVRFAGEPITPRHLGPAVALQPNERGVAVRVSKDRGLAGLLRPGMKVGVVATLPDPTGYGQGGIFAKAALENLRVLYVPPDFQASGYAPVQTASADVQGGMTTNASVTASNKLANEGVIVLAAAIDPQPIIYTPISTTVGITYTIATDGTVVHWEPPEAAPDVANATVAWVSPAEFLAGLNAQGKALTLVLMPPEEYHPWLTEGMLSTEIITGTAAPEIMPVLEIGGGQ